MDFILEIDSYILLLINGLHHGGVDLFMRAFTGRFIWIFLYVAIAAVIWRAYGWRRALVCIAAIGIAVGLANLVCDSLLRPMVQRMRPSNLENEISSLVHVVNGYRSGRYGFPSCHAANSFALAVGSSMLLRSPRYTVFIFLWAMLQCYSRIYLGVHYPGDIVVGAIIGSALAYAAVKLAGRYAALYDTPTRDTTLPAIITGVALTLWLVAKSVYDYLM